MGKEVHDFLKQFTAHEYLGDGAYVGLTDWDILIFTTDGRRIHHRISLDEHAIQVLNRFLARTKGE